MIVVMPGHKKGHQNWETPWNLFLHWNKRLSFDLDVCASEDNSKTDFYYSEGMNGLSRPWHMDGSCIWMNPPYGRGVIEKWVKKAYEETLEGCLVCALLPVSTSSKWWQTYVTKADLIYYYPKRIKFIRATGTPTFDNAIVIWGLTPPTTSKEE